MAEPSRDVFLDISYWFAVHRDQLRTWWAVTIISIDILLVGVFVYSFTAYSFSTLKTIRNIRDMAVPLIASDVRANIAPIPLTVGNPVAIQGAPGKYDFSATVNNSNPRWAARRVRYRVTFGATERTGSTSIWPASAGVIGQLNVSVATSTAGQSPQISIVSVDWQRPESLDLFRHIDFPLTNRTLKHVSGSEGKAVTSLSGTMKNQSVFDFRSARFSVLLRQSGAIVGIGEITLDRWQSFQERTIDVTWSQLLPLTAEVQIVPAIDLLDPGTFL